MDKIVFSNSFLNHKEEILEKVSFFNSIGEEIGNQNRNTIKAINYKEITLNIKSFKPPHFINKIIYTYFRKSKAQRSFEHATYLNEHNIGTPTPIAYIEFKDIIGLTKSYYISEHINTPFTYRDLVENDSIMIAERDEMLKGFVHFTNSLHNKQVLFKDHSPGNTLIEKKRGKYYYYLVDLNRMSFRSLTLDECLQNFSRLTPKKEMVEVMSKEYAKLTSKPYDFIFSKMWGYTEDFQKKFFRKKRLKQKIKFWKKY